MDLSASTSFESSPDKRSNTYVGDNTLYDSALDHQLSTTAYKTCNGKQTQSKASKVQKTDKNHQTKEQLNHILRKTNSPAFEKQKEVDRHHSDDKIVRQKDSPACDNHQTDKTQQSGDQLNRIFQLLRTLPQNCEEYDLCMRWLDSLQNTKRLDKESRHRLLRKMEQQLSTDGHLSAPFTEGANLEELLEQTSDKTSDSVALYLQGDLKNENTHLNRKVEILKFKIAALQIQTKHQQKKLRKLNLENCQKTDYSGSIKKNLMVAARHSLQSQDPETFPNQLLSQVFQLFADDEKLKDHFKTMDYELREIVQKMCIHAYERQKPSLKATISGETKKLEQKLIQKYESQLKKQEERQEATALAMKEKCFDLLRQLLLTNCTDKNDGKEYLKRLKVLYEQEIIKE